MLKKILAELHVLLTPDVAHKAVFTNVPIISFKNDRSLKDHLVRAVLPKVDAEGRSKPCGGGGGRNFLARYVNLQLILPILKGETRTRRSIY